MQLYSVLASPLYFSLSHCALNSEPLGKKRKRKGVWRGDSLTPSISHTQSNHPSKAFTNNSSKTPPMPPPQLHTYTHTHTPVPRVTSHLFSGSSSGSRHHHWRWQQPFSLSCPLLLFVYLARPHAVSSLGGKKKSPRLHEHDEKGERKSKLWSPRSTRKYNRKGETICGEEEQ